MKEFAPAGLHINKKEKEFLASMGLKWCGCCKNAKPIETFSKANLTCKPCHRERAKKWVAQNKDHINKNRKARRDLDRESERKKDKAYREANRERLRAQERARVRTPFQIMKKRLRDRLRKVFSNHGKKKQSPTLAMIGGDWLVAKRHLESLFTEGMTWENIGEWHIDHIIPFATAKTEEELIALCHYTNLQPLWAFDNMSKGAKLL